LEIVEQNLVNIKDSSPRRAPGALGKADYLVS